MTAPTRKVPRRIVRAVLADNGMAVIADDGSLWSITIGSASWIQFPPLPDREVPADDEIPF